MQSSNCGFIDEFIKRGYLHQATDLKATQELMNASKCVAYIGFDCTASSLHIGSLVQLMIMRLFKSYGHQPIILLGGGTSKIGDPSGKDKTRTLLTEEEIRNNSKGIKSIIATIVGEGVIFVNNDSWWSEVGYIDFLRNVGRHFSVNKMLSFESVKQRLNRQQHLSFIEFNYALLQAYDFIRLYEKYGCCLQIGGSDQWANIISGTELGDKMLGAKLYGLTTPLILDASGKKMGKTADGETLWLDQNPDKLWQYLRNVDDQEVDRFLKMFTSIPISEIEELTAMPINEKKKLLATEVVALCFSKEEAEFCLKRAVESFEQGKSDMLETYRVSSKLTLPNLLVHANLVESNSQAKKLIQSGGCRINNAVVEDMKIVLPINFKLSAGKKKHVNIILQEDE